MTERSVAKATRKNGNEKTNSQSTTQNLEFLVRKELPEEDARTITDNAFVCRSVSKCNKLLSLFDSQLRWGDFQNAVDF